jgi:hypothetical protein
VFTIINKMGGLNAETATQHHLLAISLDLAHAYSVQLYKRVTPERIQEVLKENRLVLQGLEGLQAVRRISQPVVDRIDGYLTPMLGWLLEKYQEYLYKNVQKVSATVKEFYSAEKNDYARITLRFLTLAIPQPESYQEGRLHRFQGLLPVRPAVRPRVLHEGYSRLTTRLPASLGTFHEDIHATGDHQEGTQHRGDHHGRHTHLQGQ